MSSPRRPGIAALTGAVSHPTIKMWSAVYLAGSVLSGLIGVTWATAKLGSPRLALDRIRAECAEGLHFSVSLSAQTIYNDIDKTMVARLSTLDAAGIYASAYRFTAVSFTPPLPRLNAPSPSFYPHA